MRGARFIVNALIWTIGGGAIVLAFVLWVIGMVHAGW